MRFNEFASGGIIGFFVCFLTSYAFAQTILIEAESFSDLGGWVVDQQSIDQLGSAYLMAHGLGVPVDNASTEIEVSEKGEYNIWLRTRNWVAPWTDADAPGKFTLIVNGDEIQTVFGTENEEWFWQNGGAVKLKAGKNRLELKDLTGFNGRCDAIILSREKDFVPANDSKELNQFRRESLKLSDTPEFAGEYDLVVVGGGMAGITSAISAARLGIKVALIQNRPVLGGNNSSEVRVGLSGLIFQDPYPNLGKLVDEVGSVGHWTLWEAERDSTAERSKRILEIISKYPEKKQHNAGVKSNYGDEKKLQKVLDEKNIDLFLNTHVYSVIMEEGRIASVLGKNIKTNREFEFKGQLFADCTGDGNLGFLAGADFRMGREGKGETGEPRAPDNPDDLVMGTSVQWYADKIGGYSGFPECPWAVQFNEETCQPLYRGDWDWETGFYWDQIEDIEYIRDYGLRALFGNWSYLKNFYSKKEEFQNYELQWAAYIGGKRESRRLMGDIILQEQDLLEYKEYPDGSFTTTWTVDLHYPRALEGFHEEPFLSEAVTPRIKPYAVPYRCLYSRNVDNLFMAGRNISVTHVALGTVRVQRTTGMMGEVVGMAASLAIKHETNPRGIYSHYLDELKVLMEAGVGKDWFLEVE